MACSVRLGMLALYSNLGKCIHVVKLLPERRMHRVLVLQCVSHTGSSLHGSLAFLDNFVFVAECSKSLIVHIVDVVAKTHVGCLLPFDLPCAQQLKIAVCGRTGMLAVLASVHKQPSKLAAQVVLYARTGSLQWTKLCAYDFGVLSSWQLWEMTFVNDGTRLLCVNPGFGMVALHPGQDPGYTFFGKKHVTYVIASPLGVWTWRYSSHVMALMTHGGSFSRREVTLQWKRARFLHSGLHVEGFGLVIVVAMSGYPIRIDEFQLVATDCEHAMSGMSRCRAAWLAAMI